MNKKKIRKLKQRLARLRNQVADMKRQKLVSFAQAVGRERIDRGGEPTYISTLLPYSRPISIPGHSTINKFVAGNILDALERDILELEEKLPN